MGGPVIVTLRAGVQFTPEAAASFERAESDLGRRIDVNSTYRDWDKQMSMYLNWEAYAAGRGPYPGHSRAIHPSLSRHTSGLALDSDDWVTPGFNAFMAERGWIRTAASDPTERHHFEYQSWNDKHRNRPANSGTAVPITIPEEEDDMGFYFYDASDANRAYRFWNESRGKSRELSKAEWDWRQAARTTAGGMPLTLVPVSKNWYDRAVALGSY